MVLGSGSGLDPDGVEEKVEADESVGSGEGHTGMYCGFLESRPVRLGYGPAGVELGWL